MDLYPDAKAMLEACAKELGTVPEELASRIIKERLKPYVKTVTVKVSNPAGLRANIRPL